MEWPDSLAASFPAPRDDEPESLRQDIADELADHLQCSVDRHLLSNTDLDSARSRALQRFGDPRRIARQLWFDALKERIMSQRILLGMAVLMTLAFVAAIVVGLRVVEVGRVAIADLVEQNRASAEVLRKTNEAMLARMEKLPAAREAPASLEWSGVKWRMISSDGNMLPNGYTANLMGNLLDSGKHINISGEVAPDGTVDFGYVRTGQHHLHVQSPWGDHYSRYLTVLPGRNLEDVVKCPGASPGDAEVALAMNWPADLKDKGYWAVCGFLPMPRATDGVKGSWSIGGPAGVGQVLALDAKGDLRKLELSRGPRRSGTPDWLFARGAGGPYNDEDLQSFQFLNQSFDAQIPKPGPQNLTLGLIVHKKAESPDATLAERWTFGLPRDGFAATAHMAALPYRLVSLFVMSQAEAGTEGPLDESRILAAFAWPLGAEPDSAEFVYPSRETIQLTESVRLQFEAKSGAANAWKIEVPDEVSNVLRSKGSLEKQKPH